MWLVGNATAEEDIAEAKAKTREGYAFFKLKVGVKPVEQEIATALAVREALGAGVTLCADANCGFDFSRAARYLAGVADAGLAFLEQPLPTDNLAGLARLARSSAIPLGADEGIHSLADIDAHASAGAGGLSLKLIKLGGPAATLAGAMLAAHRGLSINLAAKVAEFEPRLGRDPQPRLPRAFRRLGRQPHAGLSGRGHRKAGAEARGRSRRPAARPGTWAGSRRAGGRALPGLGDNRV